MGTDHRGQRMQRPADELVGVDTAAQFLGCSPTKVYQLGFNRILGLTQNDRASFFGWSPQPSAVGPVPPQPGFRITFTP